MGGRAMAVVVYVDIGWLSSPAGGLGLGRREKETREREGRSGGCWGPGVANHHMSAHGVPGPPTSDGTDGWTTDWPPARPAARREERERGAGRQVGERETIFFKKKQLATPAACCLLLSSLSSFLLSLPLHYILHFYCYVRCVPTTRACVTAARQRER